MIRDAEALVGLGKTADTSKKLLDFEVKVDQLSAAGRIGTDSAAGLREDAERARSCIGFSSA